MLLHHLCFSDSSVSPPQAYTTLALALRATPTHTRAHLACAELLAAGGDHEQALRSLQAAYEAAPADVTVQAALGAAMTDMGAGIVFTTQPYSTASTLLPRTQHAMQHTPSCPPGTRMQQQNKLQQAREYYEHALKVQTDNETAQYNLGVMSTALGHTEEAQDHYKATLAINPRHREALCNMGVLLQEQACVVCVQWRFGVVLGSCFIHHECALF